MKELILIAVGAALAAVVCVAIATCRRRRLEVPKGEELAVGKVGRINGKKVKCLRCSGGSFGDECYSCAFHTAGNCPPCNRSDRRDGQEVFYVEV